MVASERFFSGSSRLAEALETRSTLKKGKKGKDDLFSMRGAYRWKGCLSALLAGGSCAPLSKGQHLLCCGKGTSNSSSCVSYFAMSPIYCSMHGR